MSLFPARHRLPLRGMKFPFLLPVGLLGAALLVAEEPRVGSSGSSAVGNLPTFVVFSPRVANQAPAGTFAMPVSALRYEPRVDLQGRNQVEGQADVIIRGGLFENAGFRIGALTVTDPQTGHYLAELPIAPAMLGAPEIITGADLATGTSNATAGAVAYGWRPIRTGGAAQGGVGPDNLWRADIYQGFVTSLSNASRVGADVSVSHSESDGAIPFGDHHFDRVNARLQFASGASQTDLFAGYQAKFFGWPNMYTPFNSRESENLQTLLLAVNHRVDLGAGDFFAAAMYHRRNKDDYAFNRFAPLGAVHPFQHTTWQDGATVESRRDVGPFVVNARAEVLADFLKSTSLTAGRYHSRTMAKLSFVPEKSWGLADGAVVAKAGATYDDSNRDAGKVSPVAELARVFQGGAVHRVYASYSQATQLPSYTALNSSAGSGLFRGNPNLGRETARNLESGVTFTTAGWSCDAAVFAREDDSLVDWTFRQGVTARSASAVDMRTMGIEVVARRAWRRVSLVFGYTGLTKDPDYRGAAVDASFYALNYARHRVTAAATVQLGQGFEVRMDNVARIQAANPLRTTGGKQAVFSTLALAYHPAGWRGVELTAQVDNLWDSDFQEVPAVPARPRTWSVGASYVW